MKTLKAVELYTQKNGKTKVLFTTPNGSTRTVGKYGSRNQAISHANDILRQLHAYYGNNKSKPYQIKE